MTSRNRARRSMDTTTGLTPSPDDDTTKADTGAWAPIWDTETPDTPAADNTPGPPRDPPPPEALTIRELTTTLVPAEQAHPLYARIGGKLHPIREISVMPRRAIVVLELDNDSGE